MKQIFGHLPFQINPAWAKFPLFLVYFLVEKKPKLIYVKYVELPQTFIFSKAHQLTFQKKYHSRVRKKYGKKICQWIWGEIKALINMLAWPREGMVIIIGDMTAPNLSESEDRCGVKTGRMSCCSWAGRASPHLSHPFHPSFFSLSSSCLPPLLKHLQEKPSRFSPVIKPPLMSPCSDPKSLPITIRVLTTRQLSPAVILDLYPDNKYKRSCWKHEAHCY